MHHGAVSVTVRRLARTAHVPARLVAELPAALVADPFGALRCAASADAALADALARLHGASDESVATAAVRGAPHAPPHRAPTRRAVSAAPGARGWRPTAEPSAPSAHDLVAGSPPPTRPVELDPPLAGRGTVAGPFRSAPRDVSLDRRAPGRSRRLTAPVRITADTTLAVKLRTLVGGAMPPHDDVQPLAAASSPLVREASDVLVREMVEGVAKFRTKIVDQRAVTAPAGLVGLATWWEEQGSVNVSVRESVEASTRTLTKTQDEPHWTDDPVSDPLVVFRDALEQVLLDEALAEGLEVR